MYKKIIDIQPIKNADKIEVATVLGWKVVVSKDENYKIGDLVCYIEIDSKCPEIPMFEFLKDNKYIIKTVKLRKQISQGLIVSLKELQENFNIKFSNLSEGDDITKKLGIKKYDPELEKENKLVEELIQRSKNPIHKYFVKYEWYKRLYGKLFNHKIGAFPSWIRKTDQDRIQEIPDDFYEIVNDPTPDSQILFDSTEKLDGQSATYFIKKSKILRIFKRYEFGVCSRSLRLKSPDNSPYWIINNQYNIEDVLKDLLIKHKAKTIVLQGEICGEGIQKNKYHIEGYKLFAFNLIIDGIKYRTCKMEDILKPYKIDTVPILDKKVLLKNTIDEMVLDAQGKSVLYNTEREGKVWRDEESNTSFKVINPKFLLKNNE